MSLTDRGDKLNLLNRRGQSLLDKTSTIILIVAILGAIGMLSYVLATPEKTRERFTEFYLLGPEGKAEGYLKEVAVGKEATVKVGIINREHATVSYRVEITVDGMRYSEISPIVLRHDDKWEQEVSLLPAKLRDNHKVEFSLYKQGQSEAYRLLYLWVNVKK